MRTTTPTTRLPRAGALGDLSGAAFAWGGGAATVALTYLVAQQGLSLQTSAIFGLVLFGGVIAGFVFVPWLIVPAIIPIFVVLPTLDFFVNPLLGGLKDLVSLAAIAAAVTLVVQRRAARRPIRLDTPTAVLFGLIVTLYLVNIGGNLTGESGYDAPWYQGVRLFCQPLSLLLVGMVLREPRRTFRAASLSLLATAVAVAVVGLAQQAIGVDGLLALGYEYGEQVRQIDRRLRSFGTFSEPFAYTSFLLVGLSILLVWQRRVPFPYLLVPLVVAGLAVSYVRTAAVIAAAIVGLALARRGQRILATLLLTGAMVAGLAALIVAAGAAQTRTVAASPTSYLTLNGRTSLWQSQLGDSPDRWIFGRGVGATGTAAKRAAQSLVGKQQLNSQRASTVVDSGYLALVADIGAIGLALLLALFGRLLARGRALARSGDARGWAAIGILVVLLLDALSRESFTGFPTAYLGMLLVGLALAATPEETPRAER
jgi:O-antigen ligase